MPIELIIKIGIGFLFGTLAWAAAGSFIHRRAIRLTTGKLESAFQQSMAQALADKELLQTVLDHARAQMVVLEKKESVLGRLATELDALKTEFELLKSKFEAAYPEQPRAIPFSEPRSREVLDGAWSRGNSNREFTEEDTWTRDESFNEMPLVPTEVPSINAPIDTGPRCRREDEKGAEIQVERESG